MKNILLGICGFVLCVSGIILVLVFWRDVGVLFRGAIGAVVAIAGLSMMAISRD